MRLSQKTNASSFIGISTLFAHPFVRRTSLFNLPRSTECNSSFLFTAPYFPIIANAGECDCGLVGCSTAADVEDAAGAERAFGGCEPCGERGDFGYFAGAPNGDALNHVLHLFGGEFV